MSHQNLAENIFNDALNVATDDRQKFIDDACGDNFELRSIVRELVVANEKLGSFMDSPLFSVDETQGAAPHLNANADAGPSPGTHVGVYTLVKRIGEGGFGHVFLAEQTEPVRRNVALKVIKPGMDSEQIVARFSAEQQALAMMNHPNIAAVIDAGTTESGYPYFVMEYVDGVPVTELSDELQLTIDERLELFMDICQAIEHAHQKGIVHRDIKPQNVLASKTNSKPRVKVIDFGVAKALGQKLTDRSVYTGAQQVIGSPLYMSPEQASSNNSSVDTRSDIYSLGVLLYELLTGTTPIERVRLDGSSFDKFKRILSDETPPKPSSRLTTKSGNQIAVFRKTNPEKLSRRVEGDLDWIVMKCLEPECDRRYASAGALRQDIVRYLDDQPVEAGPPTASYRMKKLAYKHRNKLAAAGMMLLLLFAGLTASIWQAVRAMNAEALAESRLIEVTNERDEKSKALNALVVSTNESNERLHQLRNSHAVLDSVFDDLNPQSEKASGKPLRQMLGERLKNALSLLETSNVQDKVLIAEQQLLLGNSLMGLGHHNEGVAALVSAQSTYVEELGADDLATLRSREKLGNAHRIAGNAKKAVKLLRETVTGLEEKLGRENEEVLIAYNHLGFALNEAGNVKEAKTMLESAVSNCVQTLGEGALETARGKTMLGNIYMNEGNAAEGSKFYSEALTTIRSIQGERHQETLLAINNLSSVRFQEGKYRETAELLKQALEIQKQTLGREHPDTLLSASNLGFLYQRTGNQNEALEIAKYVYDTNAEKFGKKKPETLMAQSVLAQAYQANGEMEKAVEIQKEVANNTQQILGDLNQKTLAANVVLGQLHLQMKSYDPAIKVLNDVIEKLKSNLGAEHAYTLTAISHLATAYEETEQFEDAIFAYRESAAGNEATFGKNDPSVFKANIHLGCVLMLDGELEKGKELVTGSYENAIASLGADNLYMGAYVLQIAKTHFTVDDSETAVKWLVDFEKAIKAKAGFDEANAAKFLKSAGGLLTENGHAEQGKRFLKTASELLEQNGT